VSARRGFWKLLALFMALSLFAAACGDDDDAAETPGGDDTPTQAGGELIDGGTFVGDPPEHIDPHLNTTLDSYQAINALFDGLTEIDPESGDTKPLVAESFSSNEDATVWVFKIRSGMTFSDGEPILPSTFQKSWERASGTPDTNDGFPGDYSYLFNFIKGGKEKLAAAAAGQEGTLTGVTADDSTMTLTVELSAPYANFPTVAGFQTFFPVHSSALANPDAYENGLMIGNGPYKLEAPRTDTEIVVVKNETWTGDINGETWPERLDKITFTVQADPDTAYAALEAGEAQTANIPPGRVTEADQNYGTTLDVAVSGVYYYVFKMDDPIVGGPENRLLRKAISLAIDRETINAQVYDGSRTLPDSLTPPGIPGRKALCENCKFDRAAAQAAFDEWKAAGNSLAAPIKLQFNADAGHEDVVAIALENLKAIGLNAEAQPFPSETYFTELADGACQLCRSGWYADYPTYDNFMYDLFHTDAIGGNNHGFFSNEEFDSLVDRAKASTDEAEAATLYNQAETLMLNDQIAAVPLNFYRGDYVWDDNVLARFPQSQLGLIQWEQVALAE
jgi:oligopeptide transport system substrate-binding protein